MTFTRDVLPKVWIALDFSIWARYINKTNTHIVPNDTQFPVKINESSSLERRRTPEMNFTVDKPFPRTRIFFINFNLTPVPTIQSIKASIYRNARVPPTRNHTVSNRRPRVRFRCIRFAQNLAVIPNPF
ncbi:hypothetical protein HanRHA438_Chr13g0600921 [Helianthus annuus]|nr:hypothetical protein HanRHA438_Chr13g0600921 [Helianthus annuus]